MWRLANSSALHSLPQGGLEQLAASSPQSFGEDRSWMGWACNRALGPAARQGCLGCCQGLWSHSFVGV